MKKLLLPISILLIAVVGATLGVFAWFIGGSTSVSNITFNTGTVDVDFALYLVKDFNNDGYPDQMSDTDGDGILDTEKETLIDVKNKGITIRDALPGMVYTYRLVATNNSNKECYIAIRNDNPAGSLLNEVFTFNTKVESVDYKVWLKGDSVLIADEQNTEDPSSSGEMPLITIPGNIGAGYRPLIVEFQLKFETLLFLQQWTETSEYKYFKNATDLNRYSGLSLFDTESGAGSRFYFECRQGKTA